ncbi:hypothetical protein AN644_04730 [Candidatus Epulonipiscium fishelsonii]|nr:hypothetical protein AN644_04730 [Epulopiscium sp. SCG-C06WGA-EpuloA1]
MKKYLQVPLGFFLIIFLVGSGMRCTSIYATALVDRGFSMTIFGIGTSLNTVAGFISGLLIAQLLERFSVKKVVGLGILFISLGTFILSIAESTIALFLGFFIIGMAMILAGYTPAIIVLSKWYQTNFALVISLVYTGMTIGTSTMSLLYGELAPRIGFTYTLWIMAAMQFLIGFLALKFLVAEDPCEIGAEIYIAPKKDKDITKVKNPTPTLNVTPKEAKKKFLFWYLLIVFFCINSIVSTLQLYIPAYMETMGHSLQSASQLLSILMVFGAISTVLSGYITDKFSAFTFYIMTAVFFLVACVLLLAIPKSYPAMMLMAALMGIAYPASSIAPSLMLYDSFSKETAGKLTGFSNATLFAAMGVSSPIVGYAYDLTNSYVEIFVVMTILFVGGILLMIFYKFIKNWEIRKEPALCARKEHTSTQQSLTEIN